MPTSLDTELLQRQLETFGEHLRRLRFDRGWTLEELAARSGLSKAYLSRLESGDRQASIAAVLGLARIFRVALSAFFEPEAPEPCEIVRRGEIPPRMVNGLLCHPLSSASARFQLQPLRITVPLQRGGDEHQEHDGEEWLYVISGSLTLSLSGSHYFLEEGDAAHFDARRPHRLIARGTEPPEVLLVAAPVGAPPGRYLPP